MMIWVYSRSSSVGNSAFNNCAAPRIPPSGFLTSVTQVTKQRLVHLLQDRLTLLSVNPNQGVVVPKLDRGQQTRLIQTQDGGLEWLVIGLCIGRAPDHLHASNRQASLLRISQHLVHLVGVGQQVTQVLAHQDLG